MCVSRISARRAMPRITASRLRLSSFTNRMFSSEYDIWSTSMVHMPSSVAVKAAGFRLPKSKTPTGPRNEMIGSATALATPAASGCRPSSPATSATWTRYSSLKGLGMHAAGLAHRHAQARLQAAIAVGRAQDELVGRAVHQEQGAGIAADHAARAGHDIGVGGLVHRHADQARIERLQGPQAIHMHACVTVGCRVRQAGTCQRGISGIVGHRFPGVPAAPAGRLRKGCPDGALIGHRRPDLTDFAGLTQRRRSISSTRTRSRSALSMLRCSSPLR
jgi:hypothetical protein